MSTDMYGITDQQWLTTQRAVLTDEFAAQTARLTELTADTGDPADVDTHAGLLAVTRANIEQLTGALRRIAEGSYGRCARCDGAIPPERLEILPHARFCVPCQSKHEG
ncbi:TraR/DksA C4-type zinc finger protein [Actinoplanes sp. DH11]|uniref:TraR/DksA family transcriptional regulator n=1 Tax=Actinoplanes sp. DH11 TaxID=2857011 RepID=UPI001E540BDE|nr:TraR/DksA C4-type zinc finger protein [Actinoplanes sp. DH11]